MKLKLITTIPSCRVKCLDGVAIVLDSFTGNIFKKKIKKKKHFTLNQLLEQEGGYLTQIFLLLLEIKEKRIKLFFFTISLTIENVHVKTVRSIAFHKTDPIMLIKLWNI